MESALLSMAGGLAGVAPEAGTALLAGKRTGWPVSPNPASMLAAVGVSAGIGIFFGFWPARRAAALLPIQALRYE